MYVRNGMVWLVGGCWAHGRFLVRGMEEDEGEEKWGGHIIVCACACPGWIWSLEVELNVTKQINE